MKFRLGTGMGARRLVRSIGMLLVWLAAGLGTTAVAYGREPQHVPGTSVSLQPPDGFVAASGFSGLMNPKTRASVVIVELPLAGYAQIAPLFGNIETARNLLAQQGMTVEGLSEVVAADGSKIPLVRGTQRTAGLTFRKSIALFKGARTVMITVQSPEDDHLEEAAVNAIFASVMLGSEPTLAEKVGALPFVVQSANPFRIVDVLGGSGLYMITGESDIDPTGMRPMVIVAFQRMPQASPDNLESMAERLLMGTKGFETAHVAAHQRIAFAGTSGILMTGTHTAKAGTKRFSQYMAYGDGGQYVRMVASVDEASADSLKPSIEAIAGSIAFKPDR